VSCFSCLCRPWVQEPVAAYTATLAGCVHKLLLRYLAGVVGGMDEARGVRGMGALYCMVPQVLMLLRLLVSLEQSLARTGRTGGVDSLHHSALLQIKDLSAALVGTLHTLSRRIITEHSAACREVVLGGLGACAWTSRRSFLKRSNPTPTPSLLLLNLYLSGLAHDLLRACGPVSHDGLSASPAVALGVEVWSKVVGGMLGGILEEVAVALVAAYWQLRPSRPNLVQFRFLFPFHPCRWSKE